MFSFIARRLSVLVVILLGSSFGTYCLAAISADPLEALRTSSAKNKAALIAQLTRELDLDTPPPLRYFKWLQGVIAGLWGKFDLGKSRSGQSVQELLGTAIPTTLRLVAAATLFAIIVGVTIGVITALRQYSRFDYSVTFVSFLFFSLPVFWVAVLLKQYLAIGFNDWLSHYDENGNPDGGVVSLPFLIGISIAVGIFWVGVLGGDKKRILSVFGISAGATAAVLVLLSWTHWFVQPTLGPIFVLFMGTSLALVTVLASTGLGNRASVYTAGSMVALGMVVYYPIQLLFTKDFSALMLLVLAVLTIAVGLTAGYFIAKEDRPAVMRTGAITAFLVAVLIFADRIMQSWKPYVEFSSIAGRPVPTVGQTNSELNDELALNPDFWLSTLDGLMHIILPTIALTLISFAGYVRYTRGSLLEVLNMDYIRTARAKGLSERTVLMRHAFRNALIPLTTLMVWDIAGLVGGAVITESVFGWSGMGTLFLQGVAGYDLNLLMSVILITSGLALLANLAADLLYSALDPRIRIGGK